MPCIGILLNCFGQRYAFILNIPNLAALKNVLSKPCRRQNPAFPYPPVVIPAVRHTASAVVLPLLVHGAYVAHKSGVFRPFHRTASEKFAILLLGKVLPVVGRHVEQFSIGQEIVNIRWP